MADTMPLPGGGTLPMGAGAGHRLPLREEVLVEGEYGTGSYRVKPDSMLGEGGESLVYAAERVSDGAEFAIKIYDQFSKEPIIRRNRRRTLEFLREQGDYQRTHIMPLIDHGFVQLESVLGEIFTEIPFDIIPLCPEGDVSKNHSRCDYAMLRDTIVPGVAEALRLFHEAKLIHRDLKPSNLYLYDGVVVIADFGTASEILSKDEQSAYFTRTRRGTNGFTAPEAWGGYPHFASDYYSLGCTIAALYKGEHLYQRVIDTTQNDPAEVLNLMKKKGLPLDCPEEEADLQLLVNALTMYDFDYRATHENVAAWLGDPKGFTWAPWPAADTDFDFSFDGTKCTNAEDLISAMTAKWEVAKRYLYANTFHQFFAPINPTVADHAYRIVNTEDTAYAHDLGLGLFIQHFGKAYAVERCPIIWQGASYASLSAISQGMRGGDPEEMERLHSLLQSGLLSRTLREVNGDAEEGLITTLAEIEEMAAAYPQFGCYAFMYSNTAQIEEKDINPDRVFKEMTKTRSGWYDKAQELLGNDKALAAFYGGGYGVEAYALKKQLTGRFVTEGSMSDLTLLYGFFEEICKDKTAVRDHFIHYGPRSYLHWMQRNMGLYVCHTPEAEEKKRRVADVALSNKKSVLEIDEAFLSLAQYVEDFTEGFQDNYLLTFLGISADDGRKPITTVHSHGYFAGEFFGIKVPTGYCHYVNDDGVGA